MAGLGVRAILTLFVGMGLGASAAFGAWTDFAPRPFENGAYFELFGSKERDNAKNGGAQTGWDDTFFTEKITLFSNGFFYHPRFLQYQLSISGALKQENYTQTFAPSAGWTRGTGFDYDARLFFLPEHPYNFELFALRREPLYKEQSQTQHSTVESMYGARFEYRRKPFFVHAGYLDNQQSSQTDFSDVQRLNLDGEFFKEFSGGNVFTLTGFYTPSRFTGSLGLSGNASQYGLTTLFDGRDARLDVTASKSQYEQDSPLSGHVDNDQTSAQERLSIYLPKNFRTEFYYRVFNNTSTLTQPGAPASRELTTDAQDLEALITHRLYQSLDSRYLFLRAKRNSSRGDSTSTSNSLGADYNKSIPHGRVFAGLNLSTVLTESSGQSEVPSEPHPGIVVQPPGTFLLDQPNALQSSLVVFLRSPLPPFQSIRLLEGADYTVTLIGNRLQVEVYTLPPEFVVPGTYDFVVSYALATGTFEQRMNSMGFNTSVQFLDEKLTSYYSYLAIRTDLVSGAYPGVPLDSTTNTIGLTFLDGPWHALAEYQSLAWDVSPYRQWRGQVQYSGAVTPTLRAYATADYLNRYYPDGTSVDAPGTYTQENLSISGSVQVDFFSRTLMFSAGGAYSKSLGTVESNGYALNSAITWRIGKLELSSGLNAYGSDSQATANTQYNRTHQYFFIRVLRRLF